MAYRDNNRTAEDLEPHQPDTTAAPEPTVSRLLVSPEHAGELIDCGMTKIYELLDAGALKSVRIGRARRITYASLQHLAERGSP
jgi:excisionase family DNA binding protein